jgi:starch synthase
MKKIYSNDPLFDNGFKTIYSVYDDEFPKPLNENLAEKLTEKGVYPEDVALIENPEWKNLMKFAIEYSDGVIMGSNSVHPEIREFIENGKKPYLKPQNPENYIDKYNEFYDKLIENKF